ncbi:hypothetical protein [Psychrobacter sp. CAL346-MNA-CIBAN-0220]|uniref:hypothetical protein n=1 Tax=Psychrobacter sp. CAL346-MNA-CIBAN-0220 TaxID=3140457 RepID=UPI003332A552
MKNRTLPLSLLIGAALTIPSLAMAAPTNTMPVNMQTATADNTLQTEVKSADGGLASVQVSPFEISETKTFSRTSTNNRNNKEAVATQIETMQDPQQAMQDPRQTMQDPRQTMQDPQQTMQDPRQTMQDPQQDMQDPQQDMQDPQQDMQDPQQDMQDSEEDMQDSQEVM